MRLLITGSFDPITNGHLDIITRAYNICPDIIVAVANNTDKVHTFGCDTRKFLVSSAIIEHLGHAALSTVHVETLDNNQLMVDYAKVHNITHSVRGFRDMNDIMYESNMHNINKSLGATYDTIFLPTDPKLADISSSLVRTLIKLKSTDRLEHMVPAKVLRNILS
jgi:pantetheine-phosphate adenylyltransferase